MQIKYDSAHEAFRSLSVAPKLSKRLAMKRCRAIAKVYGHKVVGCKIETAIHHLFGMGGSLGLFHKSVRVAQVENSAKVVFFSDVYHHETDTLEAFEYNCRNAGIPVSCFEKVYPRCNFGDGFKAPIKAIANSGYDEMYRGILSGFVVG